MTEENKNELVERRSECFCQSKWFRKFLVTSAGTFVGVFCALSLFTALHKPPKIFCPCKMMMRPPVHCMHHIKKQDNFHRKDFYKKHHRMNIEKQFA